MGGPGLVGGLGDFGINSRKSYKSQNGAGIRELRKETRMSMAVSLGLWRLGARVSTKWLYFLRKICAIFAQNFFLQTFAQFLRMKRNFFCAICKKPEIFFCEFLRMKRK